jgi:hypothetical protein
MDVHVQQARDQELAGAIDDDETPSPAVGKTRADGVDATAADHDVAPGNDPAIHHIDDRDVPDDELTGDAGTRHLGQRPVQQCQHHEHECDGQAGECCEQPLDDARPRVCTQRRIRVQVCDLPVDPRSGVKPQTMARAA